MPDYEYLLTVTTNGDQPPTVEVSPLPAKPPDPEPPVEAAATYRTSGRWLLDPQGERLIGRGVEMPYWRASWLQLGFVDEVGRTGANQVRVLPYLTQRTPTGDPVATLADVEDMVRRAIRGHMLCDLAIDGGQSPATWLRPDVLALLAKYERYLVVHAMGESYAPTNAAWRDSAIKVVQQLRAAGLRMPLTVMSRQGGRNLPCLLEQGQAVVDADPLHNVIMGWQAYWGSNNGYQGEYGMTLPEAMRRAAAAAFPIQVGLLYRSDPQDNSPQKVPYEDLMKLAQELQLTWWWWDWRMGIDNLTYDGLAGHWAKADRGPGADGNPIGQTVAVSSPASIVKTAVRTRFQLEQVAP